MITATAVFAVAVTLVCYEIAEGLFRRSGHLAVFNPLLWGVLLVIPCLKAAGVSYDTYFAGAQFIHFLLGPATVALAVPLYEQRHRVRQSLIPLAGATIGGAVVSITLTGGILIAAGMDRTMLVSCAPKSVTTPVAMAIAERLGGLPALTAGVVLITGIFGAITAPGVLGVLRPVLGRRTEAAQGFALGMCAHGAGVARAFQDGNEAGAFAGLAIGLHALATAVLVPLFVHLVGR